MNESKEVFLKCTIPLQTKYHTSSLTPDNPPASESSRSIPYRTIPHLLLPRLPKLSSKFRLCRMRSILNVQLKSGRKIIRLQEPLN